MKIKEAGMTIKECYEKVGSDYDGVLKDWEAKRL